MTEQERLERRIALCQAMGWTDIRIGKHHAEGIPPGLGSLWRNSLPNFDTNAEARERLLEWFTLDSGFHIGEICWQVEWEVVVKEANGDIQGWYYGDTYAEALVSAIYAAVKARQ